MSNKDLSYVPLTREDPMYKMGLKMYAQDLFLQDLAMIFLNNDDRKAFEFLRDYMANQFGCRVEEVLPIEIKNLIDLFHEDLGYFAKRVEECKR